MYALAYVDAFDKINTAETMLLHMTSDVKDVLVCWCAGDRAGAAGQWTQRCGLSWASGMLPLLAPYKGNCLATDSGSLAILVTCPLTLAAIHTH